MRTPAFGLLALLPVWSLCAADFPSVHDTEKGAPMPAAEAAASMKLPPGFVCQVFASEPDVRQPIAMAWDARGRLWVAENYTFAEIPLRWDTSLRDRILVFEDTDGDGRHDVRKVFWDRGSYLTSVEWGYGGIWMLQNGTLSFIPDKNGDDLPDADPEVLLDGFDVKTIGHNIVNGLRWGPDGWLYGRHGIVATSWVGAPGTPREARVPVNCGIWRYHPVRKIFEVVCHGGTNSWGHDWNAAGDLFWINTVIGHFWHGIPGAYYRRMYGTHLNPHVYETIEQTADHFHWDTGAEKWSDIRKLGVTGKTDQLGGGHAHVGMLIYRGGAWPREYEGAVLTCNLHGNRINVDTLHREGCGYVAKHAPDFMRAKDTWFRGIDLLTGPDGNVFVADWSDSGECHDNDGVHRSSGRIYKIVYQGEGSPSKGAHAPASGPRALSFEDLLRGDTPAGFSKAVERGGWWARMATQLRNERLNLQVPANVFQEGVFPADWTELPASPLSEKAKWYADFTTHITTRGGDSDPRRRLALASVMQRLPLEERWRIARQLVRHAEDAEDRQQPLMIWYGIEPSVAADPLQGIRLIAESSIPTVRRLIARRISELIEEQPRAVDALVELMVHQESVRGDVLAGMAAGLDGFSNAQRPKGWDDVLFEKWSAAQPRPAATGAASAEMLVRQLSVIFGSGRAAHELVGLIKNGNADAPARLNALKSLTRTGQPEVLPALLTLINDKVLAVPARKALAAFEDPSIPGLLLGAWTGRSQEVQSATVATLASRPSFARALLSAIREGKIPRSALSPSDARQIRNLGDPSLAELLSEVWGQVRDTSVEKKSEFARWESLLKPTAIAGADRSKGRLLFQSVCGACHKMFGQGGAIGPELTGSDRRNLKYLLENILDPNAVVAADFQVSIFRLKDGRTLTGVVPEQTEHTVTIQTPSERLTMERKQIVHREQMPQSLMPEGLLSALGDENARHLFAYLMGEGQAELPK